MAIRTTQSGVLSVYDGVDPQALDDADDDGERDWALARALAIKPISFSMANMVCEALACARRHRDLLDYARSCGFDDNGDIAYLAGVAAANCGETDAAAALLARVPPDSEFGEFAEFVLNDMNTGNRYLGLYEWLYFTDETYPCRLLSGKIPSDSELMRRNPAERANLVCDELELSIARRETTKAEALKALDGIETPQAERIRHFLAGMLEAEGHSEQAESVIADLHARFPHYAYAVSNMAKFAAVRGDIAAAERILDAYPVPAEISPEDYVAMLDAEVMVALQSDRSGWAFRCLGEKRRVADKFGIRI